jgi:hypothetical protein
MIIPRALVPLILALVTSSLLPMSRGEAAPAFEDGGTLLDYHGNGEKVVAKAESKLRSFLWTRWVARKRARIVIKGSTVEGFAWRQCFVVKPDEKGAWIVGVNFEGDEYGPEDKVYHRSIHYDAYILERVTSSGAPSTRTGYRLILKDKDGVVRAEL